ncbi:MBL fold metallo-hydrolase [Paenibacillus sp. sgz5001063]|uniref:MBL fold metallo-hydrolase n=1 Tax=Paenibacillus sp. sgz5001063 TaxID=3242474 RepID=UPI0036D3EDD5
MSSTADMTQYILQQVQQKLVAKEDVYPLLKEILAGISPSALSALLLEHESDQPDLYSIASYWKAMGESADDSALSLKLQADEAGIYFQRIGRGIFDSNCYILGHQGEGVIIDPGSSFDKIYSAVQKSQLNIRHILITHGHVDHIFAMERLRQSTGAAIVMHKLDEPLLDSPLLNGSQMAGSPQHFSVPDRYVDENDELTVGGMKLAIMHTPGHTEGCISILSEHYLFPGDVMFKGRMGSVDLTGDASDLLKSYRRLLGLRPSLLVCPGHGQMFTLLEEGLY